MLELVHVRSRVDYFTILLGVDTLFGVHDQVSNYYFYLKNLSRLVSLSRLVALSKKLLVISV
jgi:hypothetical protein